MHGHLNVIYARIDFTRYFTRMWSTISLTSREQTQHESVSDEWPEETVWIYDIGSNRRLKQLHYS